MFCKQEGQTTGVEIPIGFRITPTGTNAKPIVYSTADNATQYAKNTPTPCVMACAPVKYTVSKTDGNTDIPDTPDKTVANSSQSGNYGISYDIRHIELLAASYNVNTSRYYIPVVYAYLEGKEISGNIKDSIVWCDTAFEYVPPDGHDWFQKVFNHEFSKNHYNPNTRYYNAGLYLIKPPYIEKQDVKDKNGNIVGATYKRVIPYPGGFSYLCYQWEQWQSAGSLNYCMRRLCPIDLACFY